MQGNEHGHIRQSLSRKSPVVIFMDIEVIKAGALSTFQDLGRPGQQHLGESVSGAMDTLSHRLANWAAGNPGTTATLEITLTGPTLRFNVPTTIAWCGAYMQPKLNTMPVPRLTPTFVVPGDVLKFGRRLWGTRVYLAVRGGFVLDTIMGSCSTYLRGGFGGHKGRALLAGDSLMLQRISVPSEADTHTATALTRRQIRALQEILQKQADTEAPIRVLCGPHNQLLTPQAQADFISKGFQVGQRSDRAHYLLKSETPLAHVRPEMLPFHVLAFGAVQVTDKGQLIVAMADRPAMSDTPQIAQIIEPDLPRLAQCAPGDSIHFAPIEADAAQEHQWKLQQALNLLQLTP